MCRLIFLGYVCQDFFVTCFEKKSLHVAENQPISQEEHDLLIRKWPGWGQYKCPRRPSCAVYPKYPYCSSYHMDSGGGWMIGDWLWEAFLAYAKSLTSCNRPLNIKVSKGNPSQTSNIESLSLKLSIMLTKMLTNFSEICRSSGPLFHDPSLTWVLPTPMSLILQDIDWCLSGASRSRSLLNPSATRDIYLKDFA